MKLPLKKVGFLVLLLAGCFFGNARSEVSSRAPGTFLPQVPSEEKIREYFVRENDSTAYTLKLVYNEAGQPQYFFRNVFTPVCYTDVCKPVYINFYWDLLGNYLRFDFPPREVLTKLDHDEFEEADYEKLQQILSNPSSILKDFKMDELVDSTSQTLSDSVDVVTGATLKTIKNEVIEGALYTCYTLWHIVHGGVVAEMKKITAEQASPALLHQFLTSDNHHYQYWAMERVVDAAGQVPDAYLPDVLGIVRGKNIFTARYALQRLSPVVFSASTRQQWLWDTFEQGTYPLQTAILKKLPEIPLGDALAVPMAQRLGQSNQAQFTQILGLLTAQTTLSEPVLRALSQQLEASEGERAAQIYAALQARQPRSRDVKKRMNMYKTQIK